MPRIPRRFRRPRAELRIVSETIAPPEGHSGGVVRVSVTLQSEEPFLIRSGGLELALLTTRFSRTALDGYHEHTSAEVRQTFELCRHAATRPGESLAYSCELRLPPVRARDSRPARVQWQARARFDVAGHRELSGARVLHDVSPKTEGAPVVDGRGFLPLYEFRTGADS